MGDPIKQKEKMQLDLIFILAMSVVALPFIYIGVTLPLEIFSGTAGNVVAAYFFSLVSLFLSPFMCCCFGGTSAHGVHAEDDEGFETS